MNSSISNCHARKPISRLNYATLYLFSLLYFLIGSLWVLNPQLALSGEEASGTPGEGFANFGIPRLVEWSPDENRGVKLSTEVGKPVEADNPLRQSRPCSMLQDQTEARFRIL